eukprot:COSAG01_NODE_937_length_12628_cov_12.665257_7_plen_66_part_00
MVGVFPGSFSAHRVCAPVGSAHKLLDRPLRRRESTLRASHCITIAIVGALSMKADARSLLVAIHI